MTVQEGSSTNLRAAFEHFGHPVKSLTRMQYGSIKLKVIVVTVGVLVLLVVVVLGVGVEVGVGVIIIKSSVNLLHFFRTCAIIVLYENDNTNDDRVI